MSLVQHLPLSGIRQQISRWLFVAGIAFLGYCAVMLVAVWWIAVLEDMIPKSDRYVVSGRGPWRSWKVGRRLVSEVMGGPLYAIVAAAGSLLARPSKKSAALLGISVILFFVVGLTHFWLVD